MKTLQPFFESSLPFIRHPEVKQWGTDLLAERRSTGDDNTSNATEPVGEDPAKQ